MVQGDRQLALYCRLAETTAEFSITNTCQTNLFRLRYKLTYIKLPVMPGFLPLNCYSLRTLALHLRHPVWSGYFFRSSVLSFQLTNPQSHKPPFKFATIPHGSTDTNIQKNYPKMYQWMKPFNKSDVKTGVNAVKSGFVLQRTVCSFTFLISHVIPAS